MSTTDPATFQHDICDDLTPATVIVWLQRQAAAAHDNHKTDDCRALLIAATIVEKRLLPPPQPHVTTQLNVTSNQGKQRQDRGRENGRMGGAIRRKQR